MPNRVLFLFLIFLIIRSQAHGQSILAELEQPKHYTFKSFQCFPFGDTLLIKDEAMTYPVSTTKKRAENQTCRILRGV